MHGTTTAQFNCVDCNVLYHVIKVEAGPETVDRELNCRACGAPLPARDTPVPMRADPGGREIVYGGDARVCI